MGYVVDEEKPGLPRQPLKDVFLESKMVISFLGATEISEMPSMPAIGRANAYQIPAYYYALRAIAERNQYYQK